MGRSLSLVLANLGSDAEVRRIAAIKALKTSYVKDLYSKAMSQFLAPVFSSGKQQQAILQFLAQDHSPNIVPQSAGSFPLQQACSKVVSGIQPTTEGKKRFVIHSLFKMPFARSVAFETSEKGFTGLNFRRDQSRSLCFGRERSHLSASTTMVFSSEYGSLVNSPTSVGQVSCNFEYGGRPVGRKLWRNENNGMVDVYSSYSKAGSGSNGSRQYFEGFEEGEVSVFGRENSKVFSGFGYAISRDRRRPRTTPSPQRTHCQLSYLAITRKLYLDGNGLSGHLGHDLTKEKPCSNGHMIQETLLSKGGSFIPGYILLKYPSLKNDEDDHGHTTLLSQELQQRKVLSVIKCQSHKCYILQGSGYNENSGTERPTSAPHPLRPVYYYLRVVAQNPQSRRKQVDNDVGREKNTWILLLRWPDDEEEIEWEEVVIPPAPPAPAPPAPPAPAPPAPPAPSAPPAAADHDEVASDDEEFVSDAASDDEEVASDDEEFVSDAASDDEEVASDDEDEWYYPPKKRMKKNGD